VGQAAVQRPSGDREKFAALLEANKTELTAVIAAETGKPRWEAVTEVSGDDQQNRHFGEGLP
jgi:acyl-CoA reductase-like NAD-dependent aldehyde dehydrogenase